MRTILVMRQLTSVLDHLLGHVTRRVQLSSDNLLVLAWMVQRPGIGARDMGYRLGRSRQSVQRTLERLEGRGLVERYGSMIRDRTAGWGLTESGQALWREVECGFRHQDAFLEASGVFTGSFVKALEDLMTALMTTSKGMTELGLVEPPPPPDDKCSECDL